MAKTERFTGKIECTCGQKGQARYEENENLAHHNWELNTRLIGVSEGFSIKAGKVFCDNCRDEVETHA